MHALSSSAIILDTLVKSTLLLAIAWGAALILKKRSAATQHMVRTFALAALLLLPISVMVVPAWHIKGLPQYPASHPATSQTPTQHAIVARSTVSRKAPAAPVKGSADSTITSAHSRVGREHQRALANPEPAASVISNTASTTSPIPAAQPAQQIAPTESSAQAISIFIPKFLVGLWVSRRLVLPGSLAVECHAVGSSGRPCRRAY